ncbi:hypothetical protein, partial [Pseudomonas sp.]|uniref:hypothetical protein n=1 Tax=Pseudomonas sp. TaxID=306 RepID=UPI003264F945
MFYFRSVCFKELMVLGGAARLTTVRINARISCSEARFAEATVWAGRFFPNPRNDKALTNQGFVGTNMAEAMGFELM